MSGETMLELEYLLRVLIAAVCGCLIGYERNNRNKEAGIRTHMIVAFGSALIMVISKYAFFDMPGQADVSRIAAQVVSGIGFLGAGIIFVRNETVNGLTTAAGVWATAGIGMCIGSGMYVLGIAATIGMLLIQIISHTRLFYRHMNEHSYLEVDVDQVDSISKLNTLFETNKIPIYSMSVDKQKDQSIHIKLEIEYPKTRDKKDLLTLLSQQSFILKCQY
ncbi:MAG: MgtC/SapB family protein [Beduini sp.]|uniref:MgtC/SapB family protein n=1 Tax=Beduini sp. TaxID=1922300 RepID=UPI0039A227C3